MIKSIITLSLLILFSLNSFQESSYENLLIINYISYDRNILSEEENIEFLKKQFAPYFNQASYMHSSNKALVDSLYNVTDKIIVLEKRWFKDIADNCCFGDCEYNSIWTYNHKVRVKNKKTSEYFIGKLKKGETIQKKVHDYFKKEQREEKGKIEEKIHIVFDRHDDLQMAFFEQLQKTIGNKNVIEIKFGNYQTYKNVTYTYTDVKISWLTTKSLVAEFIHPKTGEILKSKGLK